MPYSFSETGEALTIAETRYATAKQVGFTTFTSCIGLLGRVGSQVTGVHLVIAKDDFVDEETVVAAAALVTNCSKVLIIGHTQLWRSNVGDVYARLVREIGAGRVTEVETGDGKFGGRVSGGTLQYSVEGSWRTP